MGKMRATFEFEYPAPTAKTVVDKISEVSGLNILIREIEDTIYDHNCFFAFEAFPDTEFQIYCYRAEALRRFINELSDGDFDPNWPIPVEGSNECEGKQNYYLVGYIGQEKTLYAAAVVSLRQLSGSNESLESEFKDYCFPISLDQLRINHRRHAWKTRVSWATMVLLIPIMLPIYIFQTIVVIIKMPSRIRRAKTQVKERYGNKDHRT